MRHAVTFQVMQNMTNTLREMVDEFVLNGTRGSEKLLMSMIINSFTNLAAKDQFANSPTRVSTYIVYEGPPVDTRER